MESSSLRYIEEKLSRTRCYLRRRPIPFKRLIELDLQIGSKSLLIQINSDIEEVLYGGHDDLAEKFLSKDGLNVSHLEELSSYDNLSNIESTIAKNQDELIVGDDDDYSPTVEERKKKERLRKKEAQQRVSDGEYLTHPQERAKFYKTRKEFIVAKINELDTLCGSKSFLIIIIPDKETVYYHGDSNLTAQFFKSNLSSYKIPTRFNIRPFEMDETEANICSVPHCLVSRNTLSKWRLAALDLYKFPDNIPMTLYPCPENDRDQWIAELDLDPNSNAKIAVCSLHFKEGYPTRDFPYPTELLTDNKEAIVFNGVETSSWVILYFNLY